MEQRLVQMEKTRGHHFGEPIDWISSRRIRQREFYIRQRLTNMDGIHRKDGLQFRHNLHRYHFRHLQYHDRTFRNVDYT